VTNAVSNAVSSVRVAATVPSTPRARPRARRVMYARLDADADGVGDGGDDDAPRTWADCIATEGARVGARARVHAARRRTREIAQSAHRAGGAVDARARARSVVVVDPLSGARASAKRLARRCEARGLVSVDRERAREGGDGDDDVRGMSVRELRAALTVSDDAFDPELYLAAAHERSPTAALKRGVDHVESSSAYDARARRALVAEHLPSFLMCVDAAEDARKLLRKGMEERGEFGATAELEQRLERVAKSARASVREVSELEQRRDKLLRVLETLERHKDVFQLPEDVRAALARGDYSVAATMSTRAFTAFSGQNSYILEEILKEIVNYIKTAEEQLAERLFVGALDDAVAEKNVLALQTLRLCRCGVGASDVDDDSDMNAVQIYVDRVVSRAREEIIAARDDIDNASKSCCLFIARIARLASRMDVLHTACAHQALEKVQITYVGILKDDFDAIINARPATQSERRVDVALEKCERMALVSRALATTYEASQLLVLGKHLGPLQQQNMRCSVSLRVHLEQSWKLATSALTSSTVDVNAITAALVQAAHRVLQISASYWCLDSDLLERSNVENGREVESLLAAFYSTYVAALARLCEDCHKKAAEELLKLVQHTVVIRQAFMDSGKQFKSLFALSPAAIVAQKKCDENVAQASSQLIEMFVDVHMRDFISPLLTTWLDQDSLMKPMNRSNCAVSRSCEQLIKHMSSMCRSSMSIAPTQTRVIMELTMMRIINTLRSSFTKLISANDLSLVYMDHLRFDFELLRVAIEPMSSKSARDGASRLIQLAARLAKSSQLEAERVAHRDLEINRLSTHLRILGRGTF